MSNVYKGQTLLQIRLDTKENLATATDPKILYKKPDGTKGHFDGVIDGKVIKYDVAADDITPGTWEFQAKFTIAGKVAYGEIVSDTFHDNLDT